MTGKLVRELLAALDHEHPLQLTGLSRPARPLVAALFADSVRRRNAPPILWVVPDERRAEELLCGIRAFAPEVSDPLDPFAEPIVAFPLHQLSPYDELSPDREALLDRLGLLFRLVQGSPPALIVASAPALMRRVPPRAQIDSASLLLLEGQAVDQRAIAQGLIRSGFGSMPLVEEPGQFSIRGGIMDIFSAQLPHPLRLEWFGDEIESIRTFDPDTQRTLGKLEAAYIGPVREILQDDASTARAIEAIGVRAQALDLPSGKLLAHRRKLKDGLRYFGIEALLPAFHPDLASPLDFLPPQTRVILEDPGGIQSQAQDAFTRVEVAYAEAIEACQLAFLPRDFLTLPEELSARLATHRPIDIGLSEPGRRIFDLGTAESESLRTQIEQATEDPLGPLTDRLKKLHRDGLSVFVAIDRPGFARQLRQMIASRGLAVRFEDTPFDLDWLGQHTPNLYARIFPGALDQGFIWPGLGAAFLTASEIFGRQAVRAKVLKPTRQALKLEPGQIVVHQDFGIGRFEGLVKLDSGGVENDYLLLTYRDGDKLYLPVTRMGLLERYSAGDEVQVALTKLGGKAWEQAKQKVHEALLEMAEELVRTEALRRAKPVAAFSPPGDLFERLEADFPFRETEDQQRTIVEVLGDLQSTQAMDRLVVGDVGFGKTEVALRAAFLASLSGFQTLVLVPTTILALQHLTTFRKRLQGLSVRVEMLSRLTPRQAVGPILEDLKTGKVDVLIGTHRLLSPDVTPERLGLLVVDEEHRFGVRHKESLKKLKAEVHVLTLTATPLPRTLQLSLSGLRGISVIRTPPAGRRAIRTLISRFSKRVVAQALAEERARGGQVFFVHNFVRSLPAMARFLGRLAPDLRIDIAHGQMEERSLEQVMAAFVARDIDVLVCTAIIESGLDIPSANTIIVNRADRFGLSQLYQIRGRVGRAQERASAYFLVPGIDTITEDARLRLEALSEHTELGSGYQIANRDLEIRGAGNLLGKAQSGHIRSIGFELYSRLLERALMEVRGQRDQATPDPEVLLPIAAYLPEDYVPDVEQRLDLYARLARADNEPQVFELEQEIEDRFGPSTEEVRNLIEVSILKALLRRAHVTKLEARASQVCFHFSTGADPERVVSLLKTLGERGALDPAGMLRIQIKERSQPLPETLEIARLLAV